MISPVRVQNKSQDGRRNVEVDWVDEEGDRARRGLLCEARNQRDKVFSVECGGWD